MKKTVFDKLIKIIKKGQLKDFDVEFVNVDYYTPYFDAWVELLKTDDGDYFYLVYEDHEMFIACNEDKIFILDRESKKKWLEELNERFQEVFAVELEEMLEERSYWEEVSRADIMAELERENYRD